MAGVCAGRVEGPTQFGLMELLFKSTLLPSLFPSVAQDREALYQLRSGAFAVIFPLYQQGPVPRVVSEMRIPVETAIVRDCVTRAWHAYLKGLSTGVRGELSCEHLPA